MYHAVITAGGVGERFWPLSRASRPKQLLRLLGDRSMIRMTIDRLAPLFPAEQIWLVTSRALFSSLSAELPEIPPEQILSEPRGRNTAAAIGLACIHIRRRDSDASIVVQAADHAIGGEEAFRHMLEVAEAHARATGNFVTCGFKPTRVGVGFGHIEQGEQLETRDGLPVFRAVRFIEKPRKEDARRYAESGHHLWNSGIFIWTLQDLWGAFVRHMPALAEALEQHAETLGTSREETSLERLYEALPSIAVEYGILEPTSNISVIPGAFCWEDVGSWDGLRNILDVDDADNVIKGTVVAHETRGSILVCEDGLLATIGVEGLVVVKSGDTVLVCPRDRTNEIKALLARLEQDPSLRDKC